MSQEVPYPPSLCTLYIPPKGLKAIQSTESNISTSYHEFRLSPRPRFPLPLAPPLGRSISTRGRTLLGCADDRSVLPHCRDQQAAEGVGYDIVILDCIIWEGNLIFQLMHH
jgi:hypothetical protein